jgi:hypothetical protein
MTTDDPLWDDVFHGCAWAAFIDEARSQQGTPDSESVRWRAFAYYEQQIAKKNGPLRQQHPAAKDKSAAARRAECRR